MRSMKPPALQLLSLGLASLATLGRAVDVAVAAGSEFALVQKQLLAHSRGHRTQPLMRVQASRSLRSWGGTWEEMQLPPLRLFGRSPFANVLVATINNESYGMAAERLEAQGLPSTAGWGYNGGSEQELQEAVELLAKYNTTGKLHSSTGIVTACMHMSPGSAPHIREAMLEMMTKMVHVSAKNVESLLRLDHHKCVPKMLAIAASHIRIWEGIVEGKYAPVQQNTSDPSDDPWYLVMEDDAILCSHWRERLMEELPLAPADADVLKLFFFGHWRASDQVPDLPDGTPSPFVEARDPLKMQDIVKASAYELLHRAHLSDVPTSGFYAGTQAYLLRPSGARKLLAAIRGQPFQDVDMMMMSSVKHYVWRRVLAMEAGGAAREGKGTSLMQIVPLCHTEPQKDWFFR